MSTSRLAIVEAPTNLGLRPPAPGVAPGVYKLPWALREAGLLRRLPAVDRGVVVPPRYRGEWDGRSVRNEAALQRYSGALAARLTATLDAGEAPLVVGGDCSVLLGVALALRRRGRHGLVFVDGHSDFRHPANSEAVQAAAGEDLALVTGRGAATLADIDGLGPYVDDRDVFLVGVRGDDAHLPELRELGVAGLEAAEVRRLSAARAAERALAHVHAAGPESFWVHLDADVVDPSVLPAVDAPAPGGLWPDELTELIRSLAAADGFLGMDVTILDPDLDESGEQAAVLTDILVRGLEGRFSGA
ncbi:MAG TPA: arginase family protein [Capillimicrobium sp.]